MIRRILGLGLVLILGSYIGSSNAELKVCQRSHDCVDGQACVAYTGCQKKRIKRCLQRSCHRQGVNCPSDVSCQNKHCGPVGPCLQKVQ